MLPIKVVNKSGNPLPKYETSQSAGLDLRASLPEDKEIILNPFVRVAVPTGLYIQLPEGYEAQIRPRSGLALKYGITVLNSPGTVDADYRGEIMVILINISPETFVIKNAMRIAQMVIAKHERAEFEVVESLADSERGIQGFGHTGVQ